MYPFFLKAISIIATNISTISIFWHRTLCMKTWCSQNLFWILLLFLVWFFRPKLCWYHQYTHYYFHLLILVFFLWKNPIQFHKRPFCSCQWQAFLNTDTETLPRRTLMTRPIISLKTQTYFWLPIFCFHSYFLQQKIHIFWNKI